VNKVNNNNQKFRGKIILKINKVRDLNLQGQIKYNIRHIKIYKIISFKEYRQVLDFSNRNRKFQNRKSIFHQPF
jgi:hypothetical protein